MNEISIHWKKCMHAWFVSIVTVHIYSYTFRFDINNFCMAPRCTSVSWQSHKAKAPYKAFHKLSKPFIKFSVCCSFSQCVSTWLPMWKTPKNCVNSSCYIAVSSVSDRRCKDIHTWCPQTRGRKRRPRLLQNKGPSKLQSSSLPGVNILWIPKAFFSLFFFLSHTSLPYKLPWHPPPTSPLFTSSTFYPSFLSSPALPSPPLGSK